ncbi:hypothetical protein Tco_0939516 [Tanacetum coccineum]|uniref:Uncharacterized protein n=1 Tax=Tanacetum coccineum TaxID=301880 RepID=A0ABQ5DKA1_9ASTR
MLFESLICIRAFESIVCDPLDTRTLWNEFHKTVGLMRIKKEKAVVDSCGECMVAQDVNVVSQSLWLRYIEFWVSRLVDSWSSKERRTKAVAIFQYGKLRYDAVFVFDVLVIGCYFLSPLDVEDPRKLLTDLAV